MIRINKTWKSISLKDSRHIPRIRIHPKNPELVYAAVLDDLFKSSEERGVYPSVDGGQTFRFKTWSSMNRSMIYSGIILGKEVR